MKKIITIIILLFALFHSFNGQAQDLLKSSDLSTLKVDYLSDTDIAKIKAQSNNRAGGVHGFV
jgi:hypothetical protein